MSVSSSPWRLEREIGIQYAGSSHASASAVQLVRPVRAERDVDGSYLIVDETAHAKNLTVLFETRTIRVMPDGEVTFDSAAIGFDDAYGFLMPNGMVGLVRRTTWELIVVGPGGRVSARHDLSRVSRRMPRSGSFTWRGTFLLVFVDNVYEVDIAELDAEGRVQHLYTVPPKSLGCPSNVELTAAGTVLLADEFCHRAVELALDGTIAWRHGEWRNPGPDDARLSSPSAATAAAGARIVSDTRNDRVLILDGSTRTDVRLQSDPLNAPMFAMRLPDGHMLIADSGNRRVIEVDDSGRIMWQCGETLASGRQFCFPRSAELMRDGTILVADTCHDRVVDVSPDGSVREVTSGSANVADLFWPRCARRTALGTVIVADGRNGRIVEYSSNGAVVRSLSSLCLPTGALTLGDPHDVRLLEDDTLVITDAQQDVVACAEWSGNVLWAIGGKSGTPLSGIALKDPHSAQLLADGRVLISDSGHGRVLVAHLRDGTSVDLRLLRATDGSQRRLHQPRYAEQAADGTIVIVDTNNNRVFGVMEDGSVLWEIDHVPTSPLPTLFQPRWAHLAGDTDLLISDHYQHRVLHFVRAPAGARP